VTLPPPEMVYRMLLTAAVATGKTRTPRRDEVVRDPAGRAYFRVKHQRASVAFVIPAQKLPSTTLETMRSTILTILQTETAQPPETKGDSAGKSALRGSC
jgi:hypothetical protein